MTMELTLQQESSFTAQFSTEREGWKKIRLIYRATGRRNLYAVDLDGESLSGVFLPAGGEERTAVTLRLPPARTNCAFRAGRATRRSCRSCWRTPRPRSCRRRARA